MGWRQPGATVWLSCPTRRQISRLPIPHFPPPPFFCLVACTRPHVPPCPSVGWLVRRAAFFCSVWVTLGTIWVMLGLFGSIWVILGRSGSFWVVLVIWVSHVTHGRWPCFLGKPQIFWGSSVLF